MKNPRPNVLYISYDGMTDPLGQSQVLPYLKGLSSDYNIHLISFDKPGNYNTHNETIAEICHANNITWHSLTYTKRPPVLSTVYDIVKLFKLAKKLDRQLDFKIIHCRSYISAFVGLSFKRKRQKKFIFDMRGFWADERVDGGIWNLKNPIFKLIYSYFKKKEKQYFSEADAIISLTENGKQEILSWNLPNVTTEKITVIPCCVNTTLFQQKTDETQKTTLKKALGISEEDFILGYVGSIGTWYMLPEMLDYFNVLLEVKPQAKFLFVSGDNPKNIIDLAVSKGISEDKILVQKCLHKDVPTYISLFHQSIFFIMPAYSKKASSPTKQGELMAMGVPVVCNSGVGDSDLVVQKYQSGIVVDVFDSLHYRKAVKQALNTDFDVKMINFGASDFYGLEKGIQNYYVVYRKLMND